MDIKMENKVITDMVGKPLTIGDTVLVLVPKSYSSFRKAVIRDIKTEGYGTYFDVCVEYDDGRLYSDVKYFYIKEGDEIKFRSKPIKVWRSNHEIIKFDPKYFE